MGRDILEDEDILLDVARTHQEGLCMTVFTTRTIPEAAQKRPPTWIQCAIETYGLPPDWTFSKFTMRGTGGGEYIEIEGGVYKTTFKRGPHKGEINYRAPEPETSQTVVLPCRLYAKWKKAWEDETGLCSSCNGSGRITASWGASGTTYWTCRKCKGIGMAQMTEEAA